MLSTNLKLKGVRIKGEFFPVEKVKKALSSYNEGSNGIFQYLLIGTNSEGINESVVILAESHERYAISIDNTYLSRKDLIFVI